MINDIKAPIQYPPLDLDRCRKEPLWCKKEITKRLILLLLEWTRSRALPFITHIQPAGPGPPRSPVIPPPSEKTYTTYSGAGDGYVRRIIQDTWPLARDSAAGTGGSSTGQYRDNGICSYIHVGKYYVYRSWFDFDLSSIPPGASISSAVLTLTRYGVQVAEVIIQEGTHTLPLDINDFQAFTGLYFSKSTMLSGQVDFTFNSLGITYLESLLGSTAHLCAREYDSDYLDDAPTDYSRITGLYFRESTTEANRPILTITTT